MADKKVGLPSKGALIAEMSGFSPPPPSKMALKNTTGHSPQTGPISIAFLFDATASRDRTWAEAQKWQAEMIGEYASGTSGVEVGIVVYGGARGVETVGWFNDAQAAKVAMGKIACRAGSTRIVEGLDLCSKGNNTKPRAIVMVGDCFEEDIDSAWLRNIANSLKAHKIPVHAFHESDNYTGEQAYRAIAKMTNGVFAKFGPGMPLKELVSALFVHTVKGPEEFKKLLASGDSGAKALEQSGILSLPDLS